MRRDFGCDLYIAPIGSLSNAPFLNNAPPNNAFDNDQYTAWIAPFQVNTTTNLIKIVTPPTVLIKYETPTVIRKYDIVSSVSSYTYDPANWTLEGSIDGNRWILLDQQTRVSFDARTQRLSFSLKTTDAFSIFRYTVTDVRDAAHQGDVTVIATNNTVSTGANQLNVTTTVTTVSSFSARMHVAEVSLYVDAPPAPASSSAGLSTGAIVGIAIGATAGAALIAGAAVLVNRKRKQAAHSDSVSDLPLSGGAAAILMTSSSRSSGLSLAQPRTSSAAAASAAPLQQRNSGIVALDRTTSLSQQRATSFSQMSQRGSAVLPQSPQRGSMVSQIGTIDEGNTAVAPNAPVLDQSLPPHWFEYVDDSGNPYYYNEMTRVSTWERPQTFMINNLK